MYLKQFDQIFLDEEGLTADRSRLAQFNDIESNGKQHSASFTFAQKVYINKQYDLIIDTPALSDYISLANTQNLVTTDQVAKSIGWFGV